MCALSDSRFQSINSAYNSVFRPRRLSVGLVVPLENYDMSPIPLMERHLQRVQLAEQLGFAAVWLRDVPFNVPSFGDAGQTFDPFVYLGYLAAETRRIALGVASIILPLRHPAHVAKSAATVDVLSGGRLLLGVASGDRPEEYPAMQVDYPERGQRFRESFEYIRQMSTVAPDFSNDFGQVRGGMDMLPKPDSGQVPLLITGGSQQDPQWVAQHGDGWMTYPRNTDAQAQVITQWRQRVLSAGEFDKPVMQPLYVDVAAEASTKPHPIHLGFRAGVDFLSSYLRSVEAIGVNHVALNLRFNQHEVEPTLQKLAENVLPEFSS